MPIIYKCFTLGLMVFSMLVKCLRRVKGIVSLSLFYQFLCISLVQLFTLTLTVWSKVSFFSRSFVKRNPAPVKGLNDICFGSFHKSVLIGILYSQNEVTIMFFGKQIVEKRRAQSANVQWTGRAGCKSDSYFLTHNRP